jgi:hypothetical protein
VHSPSSARRSAVSAVGRRTVSALVAGAALLAFAVPAASAASTHQVVAPTPDNAGWQFEARNNATVATTPAAGALGGDAIAFTTGAPAAVNGGPGGAFLKGGKGYAFLPSLAGHNVDELTELTYSTYVSSLTNGNLDVGLNIPVDLDGNGTWDANLVFEPGHQTGAAPVTPGTWQTWDALSSHGGWWVTGGTAACPLQCNDTLANALGPDYHTAKIFGDGAEPTGQPFNGGLNLTVGQRATPSIWDDFSGYADDVTVGLNGTSTEYNFQTTTDTTPPDVQITGGPTGTTATGAGAFTFTATDWAPSAGPVTTTCSYDGGPDVPCTSPDTFTGLADGVHTFAVTGTDWDGHTGMDTRTWTVDTTAPDTTITAHPTNPSGSANATFDFTSNDPTATFECQLDAGGFTACTGPHALTGLSDGVHTFDVRAVDPVHNADSTPASFTWRVDTTPPDTTIDTAPADPGNSSTVSVAFSGTDTGGSGVASFQCQLDGGGWTACTSPKSYSGLADGSHTIRVRAIDAAGNVDPSPAATTFLVDTVAPNTSITSHPANPTASTIADFGFSGTDAGGSGVASFECRRDGGSWSPCTSVDHATATEGDRTFDVRAIDHAGNVDSSPAHFAWLVDLTNPTISITSPALRSQDPYSVGDPRQLVRPFYPLHGGPPVYSCADPLAGSPPDASGIASCTDDFDNETMGSHVFNVTAQDRVGHVTHSDPRGYKIVPPKYDDFVQSDGPTAYYRLDDTLGATTMTANDGPNGTYQNGVVLRRRPALKCEDWKNPDRHPDSWCVPFNYKNQGYSAFFDGTADHSYVNGIDASGDSDHGQVNKSSFTADAWAYPIGTQTQGLFEHGEEFRVYYDGHFHARLVNGTVLDDPSASAPNAWHHVAVSWDGSTVKLYVDGDLVASQSGVTHSWAGGTPTFFVGRTNIPSAFWHGYVDEVAYYNGKVLSAHAVHDRWKIGSYDEPGGAGHGDLDMTRPTADVDEPSNGATYNSNAKTLPHPPKADWSCDDPDGAATVTSCTATVDGNPIGQGDPLPLTPGTHDFRAYAVNENGLTYEHHHTYTVKPFDQIVLGDGPEAYYRLDDASSSHVAVDAAGHHDAEYKNDTSGGPTGISGDGNTTRSFLGKGGYVYVNGVPAGNLGWSVESWIDPDDTGDMAIFDHGAGGSAPALFLRGQHLVLHLADPDGELVAPDPFPYGGGFHQVAATWDGVTAKLFVDGHVVASRESTKAPSGVSTLYVGFGNVGLFHPWFRGTIDETSYYRVGLTDQRIYEHWLADPPAVASRTTTTTTTTTDPVVTTTKTTTTTTSTTPAQTTPAKTTPATKPVVKTTTPVTKKPVTTTTKPTTTTKKTSSTKKKTSSKKKKSSRKKSKKKKKAKSSKKKR